MRVLITFTSRGVFHQLRYVNKRLSRKNLPVIFWFVKISHMLIQKISPSSWPQRKLWRKVLEKAWACVIANKLSNLWSSFPQLYNGYNNTFSFFSTLKCFIETQKFNSTHYLTQVMLYFIFPLSIINFLTFFFFLLISRSFYWNTITFKICFPYIFYKMSYLVLFNYWFSTTFDLQKWQFHIFNPAPNKMSQYKSLI